jgi:FtsZ-binding cell division protein ZapB
MPDKKLPNSEIVKALECCLGDSCYSSECSFFEETKDGEHCQRVAVKHALDLINRLQAKVEYYKKNRNKYQDDVMYLAKQLDNLQAENERLRKDKQPMIVNSIQDDFCGVPCEFMEEKINYTQADNKRLKADIGTLESKMITLNALIEIKNDTICNLMKTVDALESQLKTIKAEAYKECIEKVKEKSKKTEIVCSGALVTISYAISNKNLDNLLKELKGND